MTLIFLGVVVLYLQYRYKWLPSQVLDFNLPLFSYSESVFREYFLKGTFREYFLKGTLSHDFVPK